MSKRNGYKIKVTDLEQLNQIVSALETTDIVVELSEPIQGQDTRTIKAEDAPRAGEAFRDYEKEPGKYIYWSTIKNALQPYTDAISKVRHELSDDTACNTKIKEYEVKDGSFVQTHDEVRDGY